MKILVYPLDGNPYQRLLYSSMEGTEHARITYLRRYGSLNVVLLPIAILARRLQGFRVVHIHWPAFRVSLPLPRRDVLSYFFFVFSIVWLKMLGYRIIWTVHNVTPHQKETSDDIGAARLLAGHSSIKITHSPATLEQMRLLDLDTTNTHIVPHGNYIGVYPEGPGQAEARRRLGINQDDFVFLFFGLVRPYKGVAELIEAFEKLDQPNAKLVIAGKIHDNEVLGKLSKSESRNIITKDEYIEDDDVSTYFDSANVACLPFRSVTTSGSALLAMSLGVPVVARKIGDLVDLPSNVGFFYDANASLGLGAAMSEAFESRHSLSAYASNAKAFAEERSWADIARMTYRLYSAPSTHV